MAFGYSVEYQLRGSTGWGVHHGSTGELMKGCLGSATATATTRAKLAGVLKVA